ncbi:MAG: UDP-N-acetylenolpyruvoylglucosamine reductase [Magnetovibrio sp.]|nr:UDP-N-acetylenolpyruvoylglucosamine reductase [Magnetovibrio sp.]
MMLDEDRVSLMKRLPAVRGKLIACSSLARFTWFKVGGGADVLFYPIDEEDLSQFLAGTPLDIPITVIGHSSNLLIRDGGISGVVVRLGRAFRGVEAKHCEIIAGAATADINIARYAQNMGVSGLEFLFGVPGNLGGGIATNAGAYGAEISDVFVQARVINRAGEIRVLSKKDIGFSYRSSNLFDGEIILSATLRGHVGQPIEIMERMQKLHSKREATQPIRELTGGSTFKNPNGHKAWKLIEAAGCGGLSLGQAITSSQHCNFLINQGSASAADIEGLGEEIRRRVQASSGIFLEWEIRRIGQPLSENHMGLCS